MWYVYIVRCNDGSFYTGISNNVEARLQRHNTGRGSKYTRSKKPVELLYTEQFKTRSAAQSREAEIKDFSRENKKRLVEFGISRSPSLQSSKTRVPRDFSHCEKLMMRE